MIKQNKRDMSNAAYDPKYLSSGNELESYLFNEQFFNGERTDRLSDRLEHVKRKYVTSEEKGCPYNLNGSKNFIFQDGEQIYCYNSVDDGGGLMNLIRHSNGHEYLLFSRDLYGYSVMEIDTKKDFHYYPACHLEEGGNETFIWCDAIYNPLNNLMAVFGCYWACPYDLTLVDFADPFLPAENQVCILSKKNIGDIIDNGYFWQRNTLVVKSKHSKCLKKIPQGLPCGCKDVNDYVEVHKTHKFTEALCRKWLGGNR